MNAERCCNLRQKFSGSWCGALVGSNQNYNRVIRFIRKRLYVVRLATIVADSNRLRRCGGPGVDAISIHSQPREVRTDLEQTAQPQKVKAIGGRRLLEVAL